MGRPRSRRLIESADAITARQLLRPEVRRHLDDAALSAITASRATREASRRSSAVGWVVEGLWGSGSLSPWAMLPRNP